LQGRGHPPTVNVEFAALNTNTGGNVVCKFDLENPGWEPGVALGDVARLPHETVGRVDQAVFRPRTVHLVIGNTRAPLGTPNGQKNDQVPASGTAPPLEETIPTRSQYPPVIGRDHLWTSH
jgi:hypothetical protein